MIVVCLLRDIFYVIIIREWRWDEGAKMASKLVLAYLAITPNTINFINKNW